MVGLFFVKTPNLHAVIRMIINSSQKSKLSNLLWFEKKKKSCHRFHYLFLDSVAISDNFKYEYHRGRNVKFSPSKFGHKNRVHNGQ